jgi:hypothetical protein
MTTPRSLYLFIGALLATLILVVLSFLLFLILGLGEGGTLSEGEVWVVPLLVPVLVGGVTTITGLPIAALVRALAPRSPSANIMGFIFFVAAAASFFGRPFAIDSGWIGLRIGIGLFGAIAISIALLIGRSAARRNTASHADLVDTFG